VYIAEQRFGVASGKEAKKQSYRFIKKTFEEFKGRQSRWSEIPTLLRPNGLRRASRTGRWAFGLRQQLSRTKVSVHPRPEAEAKYKRPDDGR